jgi:hypothetical protein
MSMQPAMEAPAYYVFDPFLPGKRLSCTLVNQTGKTNQLFADPGLTIDREKYWDIFCRMRYSWRRK